MFFTMSKQVIEKNRQFYAQMIDEDHLFIQLDALIDWDFIDTSVFSHHLLLF